MSRKATLLIPLGAALALAGAAQAQPLDLRLPDRAPAAAATPLARVGGPAARPAPDLANPLDPLAPTKRPWGSTP